MFPYNLGTGNCVEFQIRAWSENGWSEWSDDKKPEAQPGNGMGRGRDSPPGLLQCPFGHKWNGWECVIDGLAPVKNANDSQCSAKIQKCAPPKPKPAPVNSCQYNSMAQRACCATIKSPRCGCQQACGLPEPEPVLAPAPSGCDAIPAAVREVIPKAVLDCPVPEPVVKEPESCCNAPVMQRFDSCCPQQAGGRFNLDGWN